MKVKCDEAKPQCGRCMKARRVCPGYRDSKHVMFRSMNAEAASKAESLPVSRTQATITIWGYTGPAAAIAPVSFAPRLLTQPSEMWDTKAISHFLHHYSFAPTKDSPGYLASLPDLLGKTSSGNRYLESAILAAGAASLANITSLGQLNRTAEQHYGETLRTISAALADPKEAISDAVLTTIVVLQMYEAIVGITSIMDDPHIQGLTKLLQLRRNARPGVDESSDILGIIHGRVHMNSVGGLFPSQINLEYDHGAADFPTHQVKLWRLIRETSQRCAETRALISTTTRGIFLSEIIQSTDHVFSTYVRLLNWRAALRPGSLYQSCQIPAQIDRGRSQGVFSEKYHTFKNITHGALWVGFWCTLIHALQTLVQVSSHPMMQHIFSQDWHHIWDFGKQLRDAIDEMCACVPYMMADVDQLGLPTIGKDGKALGAFFLARGLYVASCVKEVTSAQRGYIMGALLRIAHVKGIKLALRPRSRWISQHGGSEEPSRAM